MKTAEERFREHYRRVISPTTPIANEPLYVGFLAGLRAGLEEAEGICRERGTEAEYGRSSLLCAEAADCADAIAERRGEMLP